MKRFSLYFNGPKEVEIVGEKVESPDRSEVLVETEISAISSGTEMLFYRNEIDEKVEIDRNIKSLQKKTKYPFKYGYSTVGRIKEIGKKVNEEWKDQLVFSFHPHESHFLSSLENLIPVPSGITGREAIFLPGVETAITLTMDGNPLIGENIVIIGQGTIGLLLTSILSKFKLNPFFTTDIFQKKRELSEKMGAKRSLSDDTSKEEFIASTELPEEVQT